MMQHEDSPIIDKLLDDQRQRWSRGDHVRMAFYLKEYPWLATAREALLDLIDHELVLRTEHGELPELAEYTADFPELTTDLEIQFTLHRGLAVDSKPAKTLDGSAETRNALADQTVMGTPTEDTRQIAASTMPLDSDGISGRRIGSYSLLRILGQGGMGIVYLAKDTTLNRLVALKVLRPEIAFDRGARERFLREAQAAAALEHENVVPVYQVGDDSGVPYLAMRLLEGESLDVRLQREPVLSWQGVLRMAQQVTRGLVAAHAKGLLHRDIKPANLWLDAGGKVTILDFGLVHFTDGDQRITAAGTLLGTPAYMSPEQARGESLDCRSDLFSLGAVLYQSLTGQLPFPGNSILATLSALVQVQPHSPSSVNPDVPVELSDCVLRLLEKNPEQRFGSAEELLERLQQIEQSVLQPKPAPTELKATAPTRSHLYRWWSAIDVRSPAFRRWSSDVRSSAFRRWSAGVAIVLLIAGIAWFASTRITVSTEDGIVTIDTAVNDFRIEVRQGGKLILLMDPVKQKQYLLKPGKYSLELTDARDGLRLETNTLLLDRDGREVVRVTYRPQPVGKVDQPPRREPEPSRQAAAKATPDARSPLAPIGPMALVTSATPVPGVKSWTLETRSHRGNANCSSLNSDTQRLATGGDDGCIRIWDTLSGDLLNILSGHQGQIYSVAFSADGKHVAAASTDETVRVWETQNALPVFHARVPRVHLVALTSGETPTLAALTTDSVQFWHFKTGEKLQEIKQPQRYVAGAWSPDGRSFATGSESGVVQIWASDNARLLQAINTGNAGVEKLTFSAQGGLLAVYSAGATDISIWDARSGKEVKRLGKSMSRIARMAWASNDRRLAAYSDAGLIHLLDLDEKSEQRTTACAAGLSASIALTDDGESCIATSASRGIWKWSAADAKLLHQVPALPAFAEVTSVGVSARDQTVALGLSDGTVRIFENRSGALPEVIEQPAFRWVTRVAWSPDGRNLAMGGIGKLFVRDQQSKTIRHEFAMDENWMNCVTWSPDGRYVTSGGGSNKNLMIWDTITGQRKLVLPGQAYLWASWAPGNRIAATDFGAHTIIQADPDTGKLVHSLTHIEQCRGLAWSPDGKHVACGSSDSILLWSNEGEVSKRLGPSSGLRSLAWSPDGTQLAAYARTPRGTWEIQLWDPVSAHELARWDTACINHHEVCNLIWTPDGRFLVTASDAGMACVWDPKTRTRQSTIVTSRAGSAIISRDGQFVSTPAMERDLVVVVQTEEDGVKLFSPKDFARRFDWRNDSSRVRVLPEK